MTVGVTMNMTFQSLDPEANMKLFNKQYENFKSKLINDIQKNTNYTHWYFGHFHVDKELWRNQTAVFNTLYELESHQIIRQWNTYEG